MRDQTDWEPWTQEKYRSPELVRLEGFEREDAASEWKFFIWWVNLFGYEDAVAYMEKGDSK